MPNGVRLTQVDAVALAVVRRRVRRGDLGRVVPEGCGIVWDFVRARGLRGGRHVALYLNANIDLEVGVEVQGDFDGEGEVVRSSTPSGLAVSATHLGPYQSLGAAHDAIHTYCAVHRHRLAGPSWEVYGHWQPEWNADPSRIRTDVFYLVAPS